MSFNNVRGNECIINEKKLNLKYGFRAPHPKTDEFLRIIDQKLDIIKNLQKYGFLGGLEDEIEIHKIAIKANRYNNCGYTAKRGFKRLEKELHNLIEKGIMKSKSTLFLSNIPEKAELITGLYEDVTVEHIYDTLGDHSEVVDPIYVIPVSRNAYLAYMNYDEAKNIASKLNGMIINHQKIRIYCIPKNTTDKELLILSDPTPSEPITKFYSDLTTFVNFVKIGIISFLSTQLFFSLRNYEFHFEWVLKNITSSLK